MVKTHYENYLKLLAEKQDWKNYYSYKNYYNHVHHSFAMTVHSAQGSTYDEVFVDLTDFDPPNDPLFHQWMRMVYVAISRARNKVTIFNGLKRDYTKFKK